MTAAKKAKKPAKKPMSPAEGKAVAMLLLCPHRWGEEKEVRVADPAGKAKPRDGKFSVCTACGTKQVKWPDGTGTLYSADALSDKKPDAATA